MDQNKRYNLRPRVSRKSYTTRSRKDEKKSSSIDTPNSTISVENDCSEDSTNSSSSSESLSVKRTRTKKVKAYKRNSKNYKESHSFKLLTVSSTDEDSESELNIVRQGYLNTLAYQTDSDSENVVLDKVNDNYHPGVGLPEFPVLLPLNNIPQENIMEAVEQRLAGIAEQIQNFNGQGHGDENWLKPETFHGNDDDVCQARAWIDRFVGFMELKGDLPQGQVVRYLRFGIKGTGVSMVPCFEP